MPVLRNIKSRYNDQLELKFQVTLTVKNETRSENEKGDLPLKAVNDNYITKTGQTQGAVSSSKQCSTDTTYNDLKVQKFYSSKVNGRSEEASSVCEQRKRRRSSVPDQEQRASTRPRRSASRSRGTAEVSKKDKTPGTKLQLKSQSKLKYEASSDAENDDLLVHESEYEKRRQRNLEDNAAFFAQLGIGQAAAEVRQHVTPSRPTKSKARIPTMFKKEKDRVLTVPRERSRRQQGLDPHGNPIPGGRAPPPTSWQYPVTLEYRSEERLTERQLLMKNCFVNEEAGAGDIIASLMSTLKIPGGLESADTSNLDRYVKDLSSLKMSESSLMKVTKNRVFSLAVHPDPDTVLLAAGDKWGQLGLWHMTNGTEGRDNVYVYEPHVRPVSCVNFPPHDPRALYTCSYDGTVRRADFEAGVWDMVYATDVEDNILFRTLGWLSPHDLAVSQDDGIVAIVDTRSSSSDAERTLDTGMRHMRTVSIHPSQKHLLCTCDIDGFIKVFDVRSTGQKNCVAEAKLPLSINCASFDPIDGSNILANCMDDTIRLYQFDTATHSLNLKTTIKHNNHTGRWLTKFQAVWHPRRNDVFFSGSMHRPRRMEAFSVTGKLVHTFEDEELLGSVQSLIAVHPSRHLVAGANSSGRLHVFA